MHLTSLQKNVFHFHRMRLKQENPEMFDRLSILMEGRTDDLFNDLVFSDLVLSMYQIIQKIETKNEISPENQISKKDIVQCIGIQRKNANDLVTINIPGGVALYPTYPLINSHCYCNTRYNMQKYKNIHQNYIPFYTQL